MTDATASRRDFLAASATAGLAAATYARAAGSNERFSVGIVGPGGRGRSVMRTFIGQGKTRRAELTAVCDIWGVNRDLAAALAVKAGAAAPRKFSRLDDLLAAKDVDGLLVTTPDHQHARQLVACPAAG